MSRASVGGAAGASGTGFQDRVAATFAVYLLAGQPFPWKLVAGVVVGVGAQTGYHVDDVALRTDEGGFLLVQAKAAMGLGTSSGSALGEALRQSVYQYFRRELPSSDGAPRRVDHERDAIGVFTDHRAPASVRDDLSVAIRRFAGHPPGTAPDFELTRPQVRAMNVLRSHLIRCWREVAGAEPEAEEIRDFVKVLRVRAFDVRDGGPDRAAALAVLSTVVPPDQTAGAWDVLLADLHVASEDRQWRDRADLRKALTNAGITVTPIGSVPGVQSGHPEGRIGWKTAGQDADDYFARRALGQRSRSAGDLFRGRAAALETVRTWLTDQRAPGRAGVIIGEPGAGKSSVLARVMWELRNETTGPRLAVHARGATTAEILPAIATTVGANGASGAEDVFARLEAWTGSPVLIAVDALDEARSAGDAHEIARLLADVSRLPAVRMAVATRPMAATHQRFAPGSLLTALGVAGPDSVNLVDIDHDGYFDEKGLRDFVASMLRQDDVAHPGSPDGAWTYYRAHRERAQKLAAVIGRRAGRNYLVAAIAAAHLSMSETVLDPDTCDPASIPATVHDAISHHLEAMPSGRRRLTYGLLTALAYARGEGIDIHRWSVFASALGYPHTMSDLDELRVSAAADFLLPTTAADGNRVVRLFHQALIEDLLARRDNRRADEIALLKTVKPTGPDGWSSSDGYQRAHAAEHAEEAGELAGLLLDPAYLAVADLRRLRRLLPVGAADESVAAMTLVLRSAIHAADPLPPGRRAHVFALAAEHLGLRALRDTFESSADDRYRIRWAHGRGMPHEQLSDRFGWIDAAIPARLGNQDVIFAVHSYQPDPGVGVFESTLWLWDEAGNPIVDPLRARAGHVLVATAGHLQGLPVFITGSDDGSVRIWGEGWECCGESPSTYDAISALTVGRLDGRDVVVSGGEQGTVQIWDAHARPIGEPIVQPTRIDALALGRIADEDLIITGDFDGTIRLWHPDGTPDGPPVATPHGVVRGIILDEHDGVARIVSVGDDGVVRLWDRHGRPIGRWEHPEAGPANAVASGHLVGRHVIAVGDEHGSVLLWHNDGEPLGTPIEWHEYPVYTVAIARFGGRDVLVSCDGTVRQWNLDERMPGTPLDGHTQEVRDICVGVVDDREVIFSVDIVGGVGAWSAEDGTRHGHHGSAHSSGLVSVAAGRLGDDLVVVGGGRDGRVARWKVRDDQLEPMPPIGEFVDSDGQWIRAVAVGTIRGRSRLVVANNEDLLVYDERGRLTMRRPQAHDGVIWAVALGRLGGKDRIVTAGVDQAIRMWEGDGALVQAITNAHDGVVWSLDLGIIDGRALIVSGSEDGTVRMWEQDGNPAGKALKGHVGPVRSVSVGRIGGRDVIASAGSDKTVRVWDPRTSAAVVLDLLFAVRSVVITPGGLICAASESAVCAWELNHHPPRA